MSKREICDFQTLDGRRQTLPFGIRNKTILFCSRVIVRNAHKKLLAHVFVFFKKIKNDARRIVLNIINCKWGPNIRGWSWRLR